MPTIAEQVAARIAAQTGKSVEEVTGGETQSSTNFLDSNFNLNIDAGAGMGGNITTPSPPPPPDPSNSDNNVGGGANADSMDYNNDGAVTFTDIQAAQQQGASQQEIEALVNYVQTGGKSTTGVTMESMGATSQPFKYDSSTANQTTSLPSMPSISNVGTIAPTGTINWKAVPGGFQPLPQTAGQKKRLYQLSQFHGGINQKSSPRDISDQECQEATNVTFSKIGRIVPLGDIKSTDNSITAHAVATADMGAPGFGLFQFDAPADQDDNAGQETITLTADGNKVDAYSAGGGTDLFMTLGSTDNHDVAQVYYASQNGVYVGDASFQNLPRAKVYVYREDAGSNTVSGWTEGAFMLNSPTYNSAAAGSMAAGSAKCVNDQEDASVNGTVIVECDPNGTGTWNGTYFFYISWLFDDGLETGLTSFADTGSAGGASAGIAFTTNKLEFNLSVVHANAKALGGDKRIYGARIYYKKSTEVDRFMLAEFNMRDGVKSSLSSTFIPWDESATDRFDLASDIIFENPPDIYTYESLNGFVAEELYGESKDTLSTTNAGPTPHELKFGTATVGQNKRVYIGNISFNGKVKHDAMMFSVDSSPSCFPMFNLYDAASSDGAKIVKLESFQDTILQFKENSLYVINISNPADPYAESVFKDCGIYNPCQAFKTSFGVIFANDNGCFIYDGGSVTSLTNGKFARSDWALSNASGVGVDGAAVPCVGYDPRSQNIIVLKNIGDDADKDSDADAIKAWVFNMSTQSWTEGDQMITNENGNRHTNFIITSGGYLSIKRDDSTSIFNYALSNNAQKFVFQTKDMDFGLPTQTKKLFKVYITYQGNATNLTATWRYNGETTERGFTATNWADNSGTGDFEVATLVPDVLAESKGWKSMSIYITSGSSTVATDFEINDISILYRARPIK